MKQSQGSVALNCIEDGAADSKRNIIFLHGFPDFSHGWRHQIPYFSSRGYRVLVPDLRGFNLSPKPLGRSSYGLAMSGADVLKLMDQRGIDRAILVAHDWGAALAWWLADHHPQRFSHLVAINVPHLKVFRKFLLTNRKWQALRSLYMLFFQLPWLPEIMLSARGGEFAAGLLVSSARYGTFSEDDISKYKKAWSIPGAWTAMLNWYRANVFSLRKLSTDSMIEVPTAILWGQKDSALHYSMADESAKLCRRAEVKFFPKATHWTHMEYPEEVNNYIEQFVAD